MGGAFTTMTAGGGGRERQRSGAGRAVAPVTGNTDPQLRRRQALRQMFQNMAATPGNLLMDLGPGDGRGGSVQTGSGSLGGLGNMFGGGGGPVTGGPMQGPAGPTGPAVSGPAMGPGGGTTFSPDPTPGRGGGLSIGPGPNVGAIDRGGQLEPSEVVFNGPTYPGGFTGHLAGGALNPNSFGGTTYAPGIGPIAPQSVTPQGVVTHGPPVTGAPPAMTPQSHAINPGFGLTGPVPGMVTPTGIPGFTGMPMQGPMIQDNARFGIGNHLNPKNFDQRLGQAQFMSLAPQQQAGFSLYGGYGPQGGPPGSGYGFGEAFGPMGAFDAIMNAAAAEAFGGANYGGGSTGDGNNAENPGGVEGDFGGGFTGGVF